ncbi:MAG: PmoA family protein [Halobacteriaceae archaeon]
MTERRWVSAPLSVDVPDDAPPTPVSVRLDLRELLADAGVDGAADARSLRLYDADGERVPVQFTPVPQEPHPESTRPEGTPGSVCWAAEWPVDEVPASVTQAGTLTWLAGGEECRLAVAAPESGTVVQPPYDPHAPTWVDADGRPSDPAAPDRLTVAPQTDRTGEVTVAERGAERFTYHLGPADLPAESPARPFAYPLFGPDGVRVTGRGKPHDPTGSHDHHTSLWAGHRDVGGVNFWEERGDGVIRHERLDAEQGPVFARLAQETTWTTPARALLRGRHVFTAYATLDGAAVLDVALELEPAGEERVTLGAAPFGPLGVRVAPSLSVFDGGGEIRTGEGAVNEHGAHRTRAAWLDCSGPTHAGRRGVAVLDHPDNPRHPTPWHCRNDGWAGASLTMHDPLAVAADDPLSLRYRVVVHRGDAEAGDASGHYRAFAAEKGVEVGSPTTRRRPA